MERFGDRREEWTFISLIILGYQSFRLTCVIYTKTQDFFKKNGVLGYVPQNTSVQCSYKSKYYWIMKQVFLIQSKHLDPCWIFLTCSHDMSVYTRSRVLKVTSSLTSNIPLSLKVVLYLDLEVEKHLEQFTANLIYHFLFQTFCFFLIDRRVFFISNSIIQLAPLLLN